ncbi:peptidylprolyl isomerase [Actinophytocola sp.]|uniref:peptidylprolyl isomerase n=1 Tax=Actinophytocola sp. TaxID=1872138 RepID=UPI003C7199A8
MVRKFTIVAGAVLVAAASLVVTAPTGAATTAGDGSTHGPCQYTVTPDEPAARPVPLPRDPANTPDHGKVKVDVRTNQGALPLTLDRAAAPCTVQSFVHLAKWRFYDRTTCHRLTTYPTLEVLQCGDPSGTGEGGPGYRYKDELPVDLAPAPNDPTGERKIYPRGTLAMANAGPDTNGSQFFLVYGNAYLRPNYTIFGTIGEDGLATLDKVAAAGVLPTPEDPAPVDGAPALTTDLKKVKVRC